MRITGRSLLDWTAAPAGCTPAQRRNFRRVQGDALGVGIASAATVYVPVFLARLGASSFEVGLLTAMPAMMGLLIAVFVGRFLEGRKIVPWYAGMRLINFSAYGLMGLAPFLVGDRHAIAAILVICAAMTIPQTFVGVAFNQVMSNVAGPRLRYELMSRRWSLLELVTAITIAVVGQVLVRTTYPINYRIALVVLSLGGILAYSFSHRIQLPDVAPSTPSAHQPLGLRLSGFLGRVRSQRAFVAFNAKRFVFLSGTALITPLLPLYYVRELNASDGWIGIIGTCSTGFMLVGYLLWTWQSRRRGPRFVLLATTLGLSLYPILVAATHSVPLVAAYAGAAGILAAGLDLVFFDELMNTVPEQDSVTFVAIAQTTQYLATALTPLLGSLLVDALGIGPGLVLSGALRFASFLLFALGRKSRGVPAARSA